MVTQIVPISDFHIRQSDVLTKLANGPVILAQRSKPAAVLLSIQDWDQMQAELKRLRRQAEADRQLAEMHAGKYLTEEELAAQLAGR
jgi:prevent-host-death family protein